MFFQCDPSNLKSWIRPCPLDNIFIKHVLVSIYFSLRKKLYCTFVDFRKAFDTVLRTGPWKKCLSMVNAIKLSIICMIILNLVFCIMISKSNCFSCMTGVPQRENLSPFTNEPLYFKVIPRYM
jgi:hypothetical protein